MSRVSTVLHDGQVQHLRLSGIENEIALSGHWNDQGLIGSFRPASVVAISHHERLLTPRLAVGVSLSVQAKAADFADVRRGKCVP